MNPSESKTVLNRQLGLLGLTATGICSMIGASIYIVPVMIQRNVPGIGPYVLPAFLFAALPAFLAAIAYANLSSAMPRAGGSYIFASRGLHPYWGFVASFSQWFGLSIAIGVIAYLIVPFLRDIAIASGWPAIGSTLNSGTIRLVTALVILWVFIFINFRGIAWYERTLIPLMILMFLLGFIVILAGFFYDHADFSRAVMEKEGRSVGPMPGSSFEPGVFLSAAALLFASFIGFDSIAQAGGEAKDPSRSLPIAIALAVISVTLFYMAFTYSVYRIVPWHFIAEEARVRDVSAAGLIGYLLPSWATIALISGAAIALTNDLPAMILSVSRLMFAWAEDGIFPKRIASVHPTYQTPHIAIVASGGVATIGVLGSHFAGDFFLGIDIMVTSMLVNFLVMNVTVLTIAHHNPDLAKAMTLIRSHFLRRFTAVAGIILLAGFLLIHILKDMYAPVTAWYFHSTLVWVVVMGLASALYFFEWHKLKSRDVDLKRHFLTLPPE